MESTDGGAIEDSSRPHGEHQKSSDQLPEARDSLERIKSNISATTQAIDELNQTLREFEQYLPKATREIEPTVARTIERDSDGNISIEPKRRGIGR